MKLKDIVVQEAELLAAARKIDYSKQRDAAYARAKWHKAQAEAHKDDDAEASKAHAQAEMDWINISQEYGHKNVTIAQKREATADMLVQR